MVDGTVVAPDPGRILAVVGRRGVAVIHQYRIGVGIGVDLRNPHPDERRPGFVPDFDLVIELGPVLVEKAQVVAGVVCLAVVDVAAIEANQNREIRQVLGA